MDIELYDASGDRLVAAVSDSTSEMLYLSNLAAGWYFIRNAWWDVAHNYTLTIASGDLPLGEISGRVTDIRGSGIANVWVMFYEPSGSWSLLRGYALTDSNGDYRFAYTAGDHKVQFSTTRPECTVVGSYVDEWYDDVATLGEAQTLSTAAGSSLTGIDAVLGDAGMVTGVITGPEGQPLQYAYAQAYDASGNFYASTFTQADGTYRLRGLAPAGNYIIRFRPPNSSGYAVEWYNDKSWSGEADAVAVVLREETPTSTPKLGYGGTISGTVTAAVSGLPVANVTVVARDEANIGINSAVTNASGQYTIYRYPPATSSSISTPGRPVMLPNGTTTKPTLRRPISCRSRPDRTSPASMPNCFWPASPLLRPTVGKRGRWVQAMISPGLRPGRSLMSRSSIRRTRGRATPRSSLRQPTPGATPGPFPARFPPPAWSGSATRPTATRSMPATRCSRSSAR